MKTVTNEVLEQAWALRKMGLYTMREIADKLAIREASAMSGIELGLISAAVCLALGSLILALVMRDRP